MRKGLRGQPRSQDGASAVEFGLVAVILLTLITGIIQSAIWFWAYQAGAHAAREGARLGAVAPCVSGDIETLVKDRVGSAADGTPSVFVTPPVDMKVGEQITVRVTYNTHVIGGLIPAFPAIDKSATSRIEHIPASC